MRKLAFAAAALVLLVSACGVGGSGNERTLLVDYSHDEFSSFMLDNFPAVVTVAPGTTLVFKQTWTGEPHTVTGGTLVDTMMATGGPWMSFFEAFESLAGQERDMPDPEKPSGTQEELWEAVADAKDEELREQLITAYDDLREEGVPLPDRKNPTGSFRELVETVDKESNKFFEGEVSLPWALDEEDEGPAFITQNAGQACFLANGAPPKKPDQPCTDAQQVQPTFDGTQSYYNSGIIPYEGPQGNTFTVPLAADIEPGTYYFYCAVHGPMQNTEVRVTENGEAESQDAINRDARKEINVYAEPMKKLYRDARDGSIEMRGRTIEGPFAGLSPPVHAAINEFIPKTIRTKVGEKVTWKIMGADHTVSFDVPEYFPIMTFAKNGKVALNDKLQDPAGGSPKIVDAEEGQITKVDGGTYDGSGFFSSGLFGGEPYAEYTLRFSEPGTYKYACLLHPPMVGTVTVS